MNFVLFAVAVVGLTEILVDSTIKNKVLESEQLQPILCTLKALLPSFFLEAFGCRQCMGFWVGMLLGSITLDPWYYFLVFGFAGSAIASAYSRIDTAAEAYILSKTEMTIDIGDGDEG